MTAPSAQRNCRPARRSYIRLACGLTAALAGAAHADAVTDWNATAADASVAFGGPPLAGYFLAVPHLAIHDALNSIEPRYQTYAVVPPANPNASPDAAIAAAARDALIHLLSRVPDTPAKMAARTNVEAHYAAALAAIPDGSAETQGIAAGQAAAAAIIAMRVGDGSGTPNLPYVLGPAPGVYQPTAPNFPTPAFAGLALFTPFAMSSASQFLSPPSTIFDLEGPRYALDYNEVKTVGDGRTRGLAPASAQTDIARFWAGAGGNWNVTVRAIVDGLGLDRWQHARLFALLKIAEADTAISLFETKYTYNFWRPVTAIRWADDGNPATAPDAGWLPLLTTPPYPDYVCGLPSIAGAHTEVLRRFFGTDLVGFSRTVTVASQPLPPPLAPLPEKSITRSFDSLSQAAAEAASSRVYGGIHFRTGCEQGVRQGSQVAHHVVRTRLLPTRGRQ